MRGRIASEKTGLLSRRIVKKLMRNGIKYGNLERDRWYIFGERDRNIVQQNIAILEQIRYSLAGRTRGLSPLLYLAGLGNAITILTK